MAKIPYFPFFPDDWLSSSRIDLLTADQERGYLRLLCRSWNMPDCTLPNNDAMLLKWSRMASADDLRALCQRTADDLEPLFERTKRGWRNPKLYSLWLKAQDRHEKAVENASSRYKKKSYSANAEQTQSDGTANQNQNQNQNHITTTPRVKSIVDKPASRFVRPTLEQVSAYCHERSNNIDPQKWIDYYTSNGWRVGRNAMKDWKSAVRTWEKNDYRGNGNGQTKNRKSFLERRTEESRKEKLRARALLGVDRGRGGLPSELPESTDTD